MAAKKFSKTTSTAARALEAGMETGPSNVEPPADPQTLNGAVNAAENKPSKAKALKAKTSKAGRATRAKKLKGPTEELPDEAQKAKTPPKGKRTEEDYAVDDILDDDSEDEDGYSEPVASAPILKDRLPKAKYFRIRKGKDAQCQISVIKLDEEDQKPGEINLFVLTKMMKRYFIEELEYKVTKMTAVDVCTIQGQQFIHIFPTINSLNNNTWNTTRMEALLDAQDHWVRMSSNMEERRYTHRKRKSTLKKVDAQFPDTPIAERVLEAAKRSGRLIADTNHPIVRRLEGLTDEDDDGTNEE
jgi:hypothetical protein